jgi:hypothetical protein
MWKNVLIVVLFGVFGGELAFFGSDLVPNSESHLIKRPLP